MARQLRGNERSGGTGTEVPWHVLGADEVLLRLDSDSRGLSSEEAERRLQEHGKNVIGSEEELSAWKVLLDQFMSPLIYVLLGALVVTLLLGDTSDAIVIGVILTINAVIGFWQEYHAETSIRSLMKMVSPKALARRGGGEREIDSDCIVPGDVVLVGEGGMVPADMRVIEERGLQIDEAALTGESVPVPKSAAAMEGADEELPPADQENMAFMGTAVTSGRGAGVVVATGPETQIGEIAEQVRSAEKTKTPLQQRMNQLARWLAAAILVMSVITFFAGLLVGESATQMFLTAVALAVAAMPEGLPIVMTVALAIGVRRMAERNAVVRHLPAVETLGSTTVIVSDKTGTLTQNKMTVDSVYAAGTTYRLTGEPYADTGEFRADGQAARIEEGTALYYVLLAGFLNNGAKVVEQAHGQERPAAEARFKGDPMDVAMLVSARKAGMRREELLEQYPLVDEVPFESERKFSATIHDDKKRGEKLVLIKGAPETIVQMSDSVLTDGGGTEKLEPARIHEEMSVLANQGLRVMGMAVGRGEGAVQAVNSEHPQGFQFAGLQGLKDPPRPEAVEAVDKCHEGGIRVLMVTGDHAQTAAAIAHQVHVDRPAVTPANQTEQREAGQTEPGGLPEVVSGQRLGKASDKELDEILRRVNVYARVEPGQKLRLVRQLKRQGNVVAVTGDGVNDAPALKEAHLGVAMGITGTDVAKEASQMVITDDNFASVYSAVEEGRTAFRNIRMATFFLLSTGVAFIPVILSSIVAGWPLTLLPAQLLWINVVTNGIQDVALAFEPGEEALYKRPPRPPNEWILDRTLIERLVLVGIWFAAGTIGVFYWKYSTGNGPVETRTAAATVLVLFQMVHVFNSRSENVSVFKKSPLSNKVLFIGCIISLLVHIGSFYFPFTQKLLGFAPLDAATWGILAAIGSTAVIVNELHKWLRPRAV